MSPDRLREIRMDAEKGHSSIELEELLELLKENASLKEKVRFWNDAWHSQREATGRAAYRYWKESKLR